MIRHKEFAVFILTHGRPDKVITFNSLRNSGYTGQIIILIDNEDKCSEAYRERFGEQVMIFNKLKQAEAIDEGDNFRDRRAIIYARNACFRIAKKLGLKHFLELDDDYLNFNFSVNKEMIYGKNRIKKSLDAVFDLMIDYLDESKADSIAMAQGGDFVGGDECSTFKRGMCLKRKAMNTFFCSTKRPFQFLGRINEDVNTYLCGSRRGMLFLTVCLLRIEQLQTQSNSGGMTELYLDSGTYIKSFYSVMYAPSCMTIGAIGHVNKRIHHMPRWDNTAPKILSETLKK